MNISKFNFSELPLEMQRHVLSFVYPTNSTPEKIKERARSICTLMDKGSRSALTEKLRPWKEVCKNFKLKEELTEVLKNSSFSDVQTLFLERGEEFIAEMKTLSHWDNVSNRRRSILENALQKIGFEVPDETVIFLIEYYVDHSEQARLTNMNLLHVLAKNSGIDRVDALLKSLAEEKPEWLRTRMNLGANLDMTPVEMIIRSSYRENLMNFMITKYVEKFGLTSEDKASLLSHAQSHLGSGMMSNFLMGSRLVEKIQNIPVTR